MLQHITLEPRFVKGIPRELEKGILYVSMEYGTVVHSCCCGCGHEVVTPLTPNDWTITYNGVSASLWPSVGNWNLPCRSHYIIKANQAIEAGPWNNSQIKAAVKNEQERKRTYYQSETKSRDHTKPVSDPRTSSIKAPTATPPSLLTKILNWLNGKY
ncbi:hypothetical protein J2X56_005272 [Herbaspirillum sp. 1173]|uniref:DUF6527 family protein n=1 Tax=Herbaspirillum sp. 1173 TaxID=2817734 RepID=UPI00285C71EA|nr:DUF6527 family protein [Herbaspirillum sp. 1173]MDR6743235.1 hypothetical protein [Herbaspirillum sp. 1173]